MMTVQTPHRDRIQYLLDSLRVAVGHRGMPETRVIHEISTDHIDGNALRRDRHGGAAAHHVRGCAHSAVGHQGRLGFFTRCAGLYHDLAGPGLYQRRQHGLQRVHDREAVLLIVLVQTLGGRLQDVPCGVVNRGADEGRIKTAKLVHRGINHLLNHARPAFMVRGFLLDTGNNDNV